jgi:uncharacterized protein DUF3147
MRVQLDLSVLGQAKWYEYAVRFLFGGLITAIAGMIARKFGPGVGGLLLAFPALLPAGATLIEKHEKQKKQTAGFDGTKRGRKAASVDAAGAAMGSIGLFVFALLVWHFISRNDTWAVLRDATLVWLTVSVLVWKIRKARVMKGRARTSVTYRR